MHALVTSTENMMSTNKKKQPKIRCQQKTQNIVFFNQNSEHGKRNKNFVAGIFRPVTRNYTEKKITLLTVW